MPVVLLGCHMFVVCILDTAPYTNESFYTRFFKIVNLHSHKFFFIYFFFKSLSVMAQSFKKDTLVPHLTGFKSISAVVWNRSFFWFNMTLIFDFQLISILFFSSSDKWVTAALCDSLCLSLFFPLCQRLTSSCSHTHMRTPLEHKRADVQRLPANAVSIKVNRSEHLKGAALQSCAAPPHVSPRVSWV